MEEYAGKFTAPDRAAWVSIDSGELHLIYLGYPYLLRPLGKDRFMSDGRMSYGAEYEFLRDASGRVTGLKASGLSLVYRKVPDYQPSNELPGELGRYFGEYGWPHNIMKVYGKDGKLTCFVEWFFEYPLERAPLDRGGGSTFTLPGYGLYSGEKLQFIEDAGGRVIEARLGSVAFPRL